ncbi:EamA family transporter [Frateuria sp. MAH-13]|uniref:EamA family transporter n=1 Tax=Frateuria flava TaxID=2821489 RepID=A0ABS4DQY9_9GAMM|nr:EamA family transporter [Frateuria flava]MBP1475473.1 EamA family transporter [Frateuria flava]
MPLVILLPLVFLGALLSAIGGLLLKAGAVRLPPIHGVLDLWFIFLNWRILAGLALYFIPAVLWILLLRKVDLSLLQPLMSMVYVITPVLALYIFKEHVSTLRWAGIGVIMIGVALISRS